MSLTSYRAAPPRGEAFGLRASRLGAVRCLGPGSLPSVSSRSRRRGRLVRRGVVGGSASDGSVGGVSAGPGRGFVKLEDPERGGVRGDRLGDDDSKVEETRSRREGGVTNALGRPGSDLLSRVLRRSTIGAEGFHGRVRNGNGLGPLARTTRPAKSIRDVNVWRSMFQTAVHDGHEQ